MLVVAAAGLCLTAIQMALYWAPLVRVVQSASRDQSPRIQTTGPEQPLQAMGARVVQAALAPNRAAVFRRKRDGWMKRPWTVANRRYIRSGWRAYSAGDWRWRWGADYDQPPVTTNTLARLSRLPTDPALRRYFSDSLRSARRRAGAIRQRRFICGLCRHRWQHYRGCRTNRRCWWWGRVGSSRRNRASAFVGRP